jgi:hypothetical protein
MGYNPAHYDRTKGMTRLAKEAKKRRDQEGRPCHTSDSSYWWGIMFDPDKDTMNPFDKHHIFTSRRSLKLHQTEFLG